MRRFVLVFAALFLVSCSTVTSKSLPKSLEDPTPEGISYYLPKRLHRVKISVTKIRGDMTGLKKAQEEYQKASVAKVKAQQDYDVVETKFKADEALAGKAEGDAKKKAEEWKGLSLAEFEVKKSALRDATAKEAEAYDKLSELMKADPTAKNNLVKFSIEPLPLVPDTDQGFVAAMRHSPFRKDQLNLTTTEMGLLSSAKSIAEDQTGKIAATIAQAIVSLGGMPAPYAAASTIERPKEEKEEEKDLEIDSVVDLADKDGDVKKLRCNLKKKKLDFVIVPPFDGDKPSKAPNCEEPKKTPSIHGNTKDGTGKPCGEEGLFYRRELPYLVKITREDGGDDIPQANALVFMPNRSPITRVPMEAGPFVTSKNTVAFTNGMLTSIEVERPSEILGLVSIPADVAQTMITAISQMIKLRLDYSSSQVNLAKDQSALLDLMKEIAKKQQEAQVPAVK